MKKFLSILLTVAMVLSMLCLPAVAAVTTEDFSGTGTEADPYVIKTAAGFAHAKELLMKPVAEGGLLVPVYKTEVVNEETGEKGLTADLNYYMSAPGKFFKLDSNLTIAASNQALLSGTSDTLTAGADTPEDTSDDKYALIYFAGSFDGNNKTITMTGTANFSDRNPAGMFFDILGGGHLDLNGDGDYADENEFSHVAVVKDLTITNAAFNQNTTSSGQAGILAGAVYKDATISNVAIVNATIKSVDKTNAHNNGGFVGKHNGGDLLMENCSFSGTISEDDTDATTKKARNGGLIGSPAASGASDELTVRNCTVSGSVSSLSVAGGFFGLMGGKATVSVSNCVNAATVNGGQHAGGLVGQSNAASATITFENCINLADITSGTGSAGGIWGNHSGKNNALSILGCVNIGNISSSGQRAAGIFTHVSNAKDSGKTATVTINDCINFGNVASTATTAPTATTVNAFSIFCMISTGTASSTNCVNFGSRTGWVKEGDVYVSTTAAAMQPGTVGTNYTDFAASATGGSVVVSSALLRVLEGARIRLAATADDGGIRYDIASNKALLDKLDVTYDIKLGSKMSAAADVASTNYKDLASASSKEVAYATDYLKADGTYSAAAIGITNYATEYNCGGFITLTKGEGASAVTYTIYTEAGSARSLQYIAAAAMADDAANEDVNYSDYNDLLETYKGDYELPTT